MSSNRSVPLGKYGSFNSDDLLGRPFYLTYEILENVDGKGQKGLRIVQPFELYESSDSTEPNGPALADVAGEAVKDAPEFEVVDAEGKVLMKTNREILDDSGAQKLTMEEIEALKKADATSGKDTIAKIMASNSQLDKKTTFGLAKYTLRKTKKFSKRFTVLPLNVTLLAYWWLSEKEAPRIMEIREETLALVVTWLNAHHSGLTSQTVDDQSCRGLSKGRWLVIDDTGGLLVAAIAEKLGVLYPTDEETEDEAQPVGEDTNSTSDTLPTSSRQVAPSVVVQETHMSGQTNTITLIHPNSQPNLALLNYFHYDSSNSSPSSPLHYHLKSLSWLQFLCPDEDATSVEPEVEPEEVLQSWKSGKRGTYYRKRRRWERIRAVIDDTHAGGFDGLFVASAMIPQTILHHLVPLLRGGAPVVVYSPNVEPLAELSDCYSVARKTAFVSGAVEAEEVPTEDFPLNPTLLLSPTIYTVRARPWQVLPGRTHPMMMGMGGAEGYAWTATRVLPIEGERVEARGSYKRRKTLHM